jgi:hypothetical protein
MPSKKLLAAAIVAASVVGGGIAGALIGTPSLLSAQETDDQATTTTVKDESSESTEHDGPRRCHGHHRLHKPDLGVVAEVLGISEDDLREAMRDGNSIADVAEEQDVDVDTVIAALVKAATEKLDAAVAEGDLDADRAAEVKENLEERITNLVNGEMPRGGLRHFQRPDPAI